MVFLFVRSFAVLVGVGFLFGNVSGHYVMSFCFYFFRLIVFSTSGIYDSVPASFHVRFERINTHLDYLMGFYFNFDFNILDTIFEFCFILFSLGFFFFFFFVFLLVKINNAVCAVVPPHGLIFSASLTGIFFWVLEILFWGSEL
jgi:hypothetical protein